MSSISHVSESNGSGVTNGSAKATKSASNVSGPSKSKSAVKSIAKSAGEPVLSVLSVKTAKTSKTKGSSTADSKGTTARDTASTVLATDLPVVPEEASEEILPTNATFSGMTQAGLAQALKSIQAEIRARVSATIKSKYAIGSTIKFQAQLKVFEGRVKKRNGRSLTLEVSDPEYVDAKAKTIETGVMTNVPLKFIVE